MDIRAKQETFGWTRNHCTPSEPHQELVPDYCLFKPLQHNNQVWILYWPELTV